MLIWYTGHGEKGTGNWVLKDGCLKFEDIYNLYINHFKSRYLYIVTDCCYSGSWVVDCARLLDRDGIKCGHDAKRQNVYIRVFASCLPNEQAWDKFYTECRGVKLHPNGARRTIAFAEHRKLECEPEKYHQTTLGVDFTRTNGCLGDDSKNCHSTWTTLVQRLCDEECSKNYLIWTDTVLMSRKDTIFNVLFLSCKILVCVNKCWYCILILLETIRFVIQNLILFVKGMYGIPGVLIIVGVADKS